MNEHELKCDEKKLKPQNDNLNKSYKRCIKSISYINGNINNDTRQPQLHIPHTPPAIIIQR